MPDGWREVFDANPHITILEERMEQDRLILHTVHTDDGATELYWGRATDDHLVTYEGSLLFHRDGSITWKCWTDAEVPVVVQILANRVVVAVTEDQPVDEGGDGWVFDSKTLTNENSP